MATVSGAKMCKISSMRCCVCKANEHRERMREEETGKVIAIEPKLSNKEMEMTSHFPLNEMWQPKDTEHFR